MTTRKIIRFTILTYVFLRNYTSLLLFRVFFGNYFELNILCKSWQSDNKQNSIIISKATKDHMLFQRQSELLQLICQRINISIITCN